MKEVHTIITPNNHESAKNSPRERAFSSQEEMERFITEQLDRCASLGDVRELFYDRLLTQREKLRAVSHHTKRHFLERVAQLINVRDEGAADFWNELGDEVYSSWLTDCRKEVAHALNFLDGASLEKTVNYVQMIRKFYVHGYDYTQDYTEKFSSIATKIKEQTDDAQAIFFASVIGKEALRAITEKIVPSYLAEPTEQDAEDNKEEDLLREEMGDEAFERYADNLFYEGSRMIDHDPDRTDVPFVIARNRFGQHTANGLFLSAERDYERLKKDYAHFNTWADREFYHPGGHDAESGMSWYDADEHAYEGVESNYGSVLNDHAYHEAEAYLSSMIRRISIPIASMEKISDHPEDVQSYILFTSLRMQHFLQEQGFALQDLSVQEQFFFLRYAKIVRNHEAEQLKSFVRRFGSRGLKSFLSLQHSGHDMGTKILHIGEKYDHTTADAIFAKYAELVNVTDSVEDYLATQFDDHADVDRKEIGEKLLVNAKDLLESYADRDDIVSGEDIIAALEKINARVTLTAEIIKQLPRESVAQLDLIKLSDVERHIDLTAKELQTMPDLLAKMAAVVHDKFPAGDVQSFREDCLSERNSGVTVTLANGDILSFFMKKKVGGHLSELDWFSANPDAPIKGIGEATALLGFNHARNKEESYYAVAKPHVKSLSTLIELQGFVGFGGMTQNGEYKHHYIRTRRLAQENPYIIKQLSREQQDTLLQALQETCAQGNMIYPLRYDTTNYDAARISFFGLTHADDMTEHDDHGWIYQEMKRQANKGNVLVRYIPASDAKDNVTYYAVFAPDNSTADERREVEDYVRSKEVHSA